MPMNTRGQLILLWSAPVAGALFLLAYFMFPAFAPPMSPTMTPEQVASFFREHTAGIRGVVVLCNLIGCTLVPLFAIIAVQMLRARFEEDLLTRAFPAYTTYAAHTPRLIPFLW